MISRYFGCNMKRIIHHTLYLTSAICSIFCVTTLQTQGEFFCGNFLLKETDRALMGHVVKTFDVKEIMECLMKCNEYAQCKSINYQKGLNSHTCELNDGKVEESGTNILAERLGFLYYELIEEGSNTCLNGGKPIKQCSFFGRPYYRCECQYFFTGENCQYSPKSCRTLYDFDPALPSGNYSLYDKAGHSYKAYCDFTIESGKVWTLVMSYTLANNLQYKKMSLLNDNARNENEINWEDYRLSKTRMATIQNDTTHWRMTCNYNTQSIKDKVDYLRVKNMAYDVLSHNTEFYPDNDRCNSVEYLNIRGDSCSNCSVAVSQDGNDMLCINNYFNKVSSCDWQYPGGFHICVHFGEFNFGLYECVNTNFRCSSSPSSTTQMWFGS